MYLNFHFQGNMPLGRLLAIITQGAFLTLQLMSQQIMEDISHSDYAQSQLLGEIQPKSALIKMS